MRSCYEYQQSGLTASGTYKIDPDGVNFGEPPFEVECDFTTGETKVLHDAMENERIPICGQVDCFQINIKYPTSTKQLINLIDLSGTCSQRINVNLFTL